MMETLNTKLNEGILSLNMNVPSKLNALTDELRTELRDTLASAQDDPEVMCIVISGMGGNFCSGGDISAMTSDRIKATSRMTILHDIVRLLIVGTKPSVAAVSGSAYGAGFSLALCCDQVIADTTAKFCASFGRMGLAPDMGLAWTLPHRVRGAAARKILLGGRIIKTDEAEKLGIVDAVVKPSALRDVSRKLAIELTSYAQTPKGYVKSMLAESCGFLEAFLASEMRAYLQLLNSEEHQVAKDAFQARSK
ncbi:MAG: enoyl-CoA hydratase/isomerase family protein [Rhodospirillales bacterium]